jgi:hypothetical protein
MPYGTLPQIISASLLRKSRVELEKLKRDPHPPFPLSETCLIEKVGRKEFVPTIRAATVTANLATTANTSTRDQKGGDKKRENTSLFVKSQKKRKVSFKSRPPPNKREKHTSSMIMKYMKGVIKENNENDTLYNLVRGGKSNLLVTNIVGEIECRPQRPRATVMMTTKLFGSNNGKDYNPKSC